MFSAKVHTRGLILRYHRILCCAILLAGRAHAHGIEITATAGPDSVLRGEVFYADGEPVQRERVEVFRSSEDRALYSGLTNDSGRFAFLIADGANYRVVVAPLDGHRAEAAVTMPAVAGHLSPSGATAGGVGAAEFGLLRADLARLERRLRLSDVVGGIGLIAGLAGAGVLIGRRKAG